MDAIPSWGGTPTFGQVRSYAAGWSNHYPTTDDLTEREASINLASIAPWCVPGHHEENGGADERGPWLRLSMDTWQHDCAVVSAPIHASVVMDERAVVALRDQLDEWLAKPKLHPDA